MHHRAPSPGELLSNRSGAEMAEPQSGLPASALDRITLRQQERERVSATEMEIKEKVKWGGKNEKKKKRERP